MRVCPESAPQTENLGSSKWTDPGSISNHLPKEAEGQSEDTEELVTPVETFTKLLLGGHLPPPDLLPQTKAQGSELSQVPEIQVTGLCGAMDLVADFFQDERRSKTFLRKSSNGGDAAGRSPTVRAVCPE